MLLLINFIFNSSQLYAMVSIESDATFNSIGVIVTYPISDDPQLNISATIRYRNDKDFREKSCRKSLSLQRHLDFFDFETVFTAPKGRIITARGEAL
jgi:hypothetical protein